MLRGRGTGGGLPRASAVDLLTELSERVPPEVQVRFEKMDVTRDKLHLEGATDAAESVDKLVTGLKTSRCFTDAHSGSARKRADGKFEFSIDSGLSCLDTGVRDARRREGLTWNGSCASAPSSSPGWRSSPRASGSWSRPRPRRCWSSRPP